MAGELGALNRSAAEAAILAGLVLGQAEYLAVNEHKGVWITAEGLLVLVGKKSTRLGFECRSGLELTDDLVARVAMCNQVDEYAHVWLAEDDAEEWSVIWGDSFRYTWHTTESLTRLVSWTVRTTPERRAALTALFAEFGGVSFRAGATSGPALDLMALTLWDQLG